MNVCVDVMLRLAQILINNVEKEKENMSKYTNFSLEGKVALVTGASYGIGFAIATAYAEAGCQPQGYLQVHSSRTGGELSVGDGNDEA